jgi:hypothetical protein
MAKCLLSYGGRIKVTIWPPVAVAELVLGRRSRRRTNGFVHKTKVKRSK